MWLRKIQPFAWLLLFVCIAVAAGSWELCTKHLEMQTAGEVDWFAEDPDSFASVIQSIIPQSNQANFTRGVQAGRQGADLPAARKYLELAIANHAKDNEELLYAYVIVLLNMDVPLAEIDNAIVNWRRSFPQSKRPLLIPYAWYFGQPVENLSKPAQDALRSIPAVEVEQVVVGEQSKVIAVPFAGESIEIATILQALTDAGLAVRPVDGLAN